MCGILFLNTTHNDIPNYPKTHDEILKRFNRINYRGPNNTSIISHNNKHFCHHRLSIINPNSTSGNQPFCLKDVILICNGEIYNYLSLLSSHLDNMTVENDCEIIIHLYRKYGMQKTLELIDGDFAFIMYDKLNDTIITARDPVGLKPLYTGSDKHGHWIGISSEIKCLSDICEFINTHPIGCYKVYDIAQQYFPYRLQIEPNCVEENIKNLLTSAIQKRITHTDRSYAFLCSGGIDSSLILAIACEFLNKKNIHVFSVQYDDGSVSYDSFYATMLAQKYDVKHTIVKFTKEEGLNHIDEVIKKIETYDINTIRASIPMYLLAKYISQNTDYKVILSGEGADELFMGYSYFNFCPTEKDASEESLRLVRNLHSFDVLRAERCFSSHGLELRVPFLDKDFIQYVMNIDGRLPYDGIEKYILRESFKELKEMPKQILYRQKERLSDGIGFMWVPTLIRYCNEQVEEMKEEYDYNRPKDKEEYYYRNIFEKYYPGKATVILERRMPIWLEQKMKDIKNTKLID